MPTTSCWGLFPRLYPSATWLPQPSTLLEAQPGGRTLQEEVGAGMVVTGSPGTGTVVPESAVVDGLGAHGILGMDIGSALHQHLNTSQQAIAGSQVQGCGAVVCLPVRFTRGKGQKGKGKALDRQANQLPGPTLPPPWGLCTCPALPGGFTFL